MSNHPSTVTPTEPPRPVADALLPGETARPVPGASNYWATSFGSVVSTARRGACRLGGGLQTKKYLQVTITFDDRSVWRPCVHQVVALAFHGPAPVEDGVRHDVHHKDGDKRNNRPENLEYISKATHARLTAMFNRTDVKLCPEAVFVGRCRALVEDFKAVVASMADSSGAAPVTVSQALRGRTWRAVPFPQNVGSAAELEKGIGVSAKRARVLFERVQALRGVTPKRPTLVNRPAPFRIAA